VSLITDQNRRWWGLGALSVSLFMIMLDNTVVSVALPSIQADLNTSLSQLEWVINAYSMVFAVLLISGGKFADYLGRRRIFVAGLVVFTLSSLACGLASSAEVLIGARAFQGIGAALMLPATLSIISATFPVAERGLAIGIWAGVSGLALAIGPLVGGLLAQHAGWQWIFYINVPVGVVGVLTAYWLITESRDTASEQRLDLPGLVASALTVFLLTYALTEANSYGWGSPRIVACFVGAAVALVVFVVLESRQRLPMLDLRLFRNSTFAGGNVCGLLIFVALFGQIFYSSLFLQAVLRYSPVQAGATFLIATGAIAATAPISGKLSDRIGSRIPMTVGMASFGVAMTGLSFLDETSNLWNMFPWLLIGGFGFGLIMPAMTAAILGAVPVDSAGVASGAMQSFRQLGGGLGVALMGALVARKVGDLAPGSLRYAIAFVPGYQDAMLLGAVAAFASAVVAFATIRHHVTREAPAAEPAQVPSSPAAASTRVIGAPTRVVAAPTRIVATPFLSVVSGDGAGNRVPVVGEIVIGRESADIVVPDDTASRRHAAVRPTAEGLELVDLGSSNGTFVNGRRIEGPHLLSDGDEIAVAGTTFAVELPEAAPEPEPEPPQPVQTLVFRSGPREGERLLVNHQLTFGREDVDVVFDDPEVSRRHALVFSVDGELEVTDCGSANGTYVNDVRIDTATRLSDGDTIRLGRTKLAVEVSSAGSERMTPSSAPSATMVDTETPGAR